MTSENDIFRLFEANANGMQEFARLSGEASQRRRLPRPSNRPKEVVPVPVAAVPAEPAQPRRSLWERLGLVTPPRKPRRRLSSLPQGLVPSQTS